MGRIMALFFLVSLTSNLVSVYILNDPITESVKFSVKIVKLLTTISLWIYNKVVGSVIETPLQLIVGKNETVGYTIEIAGGLGFYESPFNLIFNETIHHVNGCSEKGLIIWKIRKGGQLKNLTKKIFKILGPAGVEPTLET